MHTDAMNWSPSPSGTVWRKRVHLVGPPESGQVTSVVRYEPDATFPSHDHPEGEEILVLEGVFSDEHGDWPAGTYLLNPEGFRHAPFSRDGCTLFVKLRQFPGTDREHHVIDTEVRSWGPGDNAGIAVKHLYAQDGFDDSTSIERWQPGTSPGEVAYSAGAEFFVLDGELEDREGTYPKGSWLRIPAGGSHTPATSIGCTVYVKRGGFPYLRGYEAGKR
ncbi:MAG: cupin domain-containing protein [Woeseiaceae bacterium]|nr:cupin domain-containing protein [Woeseiaceae bacterium]